MASHLGHLKTSVPDIASRRVLDIGAGRGEFLIDCAKQGIRAQGVEFNPKKVVIAREKAHAAGVSIDIEEGDAEALRFPDASFDFLNMCELIEHVQHPDAALREAARVLAPGGVGYVSVPSRFSWYDTHFHVPFVNWLPRSLSEPYLKLWGKGKQYDGAVDLQRLSEMHYYTFGAFVRAVRAAGFSAEDLRERKIRARMRNPLVRSLAIFAYRLARPWYFRAFHVLIRKP